MNEFLVVMTDGTWSTQPPWRVAPKEVRWTT